MIVHEEWLLTADRVAVHRPTATAVIADLHLGYAEARHRSGEVVPCPDLRALLAPLGAVLEGNRARRLVIAGDLFEAGPTPELTQALLGWLKEAGIELAGVVPGNHDQGLADAALPVCVQGVVLGRWRVVHGDGKLPEGAVLHGHEHPCLRWAGITAGCYLVGADRLVLPAFSSDAAGVNVLGDSRWADWRCAVIAGEQVLDFGQVGGLPGRLRRSRRNS